MWGSLMKELKDRILKEGKALNETVLKVDSFLVSSNTVIYILANDKSFVTLAAVTVTNLISGSFISVAKR